MKASPFARNASLMFMKPYFLLFAKSFCHFMNSSLLSEFPPTPWSPLRSQECRPRQVCCILFRILAVHLYCAVIIPNSYTTRSAFLRSHPYPPARGRAAPLPRLSRVYYRDLLVVILLFKHLLKHRMVKIVVRPRAFDLHTRHRVIESRIPRC